MYHSHKLVESHIISRLNDMQEHELFDKIKVFTDKVKKME